MGYRTRSGNITELSALGKQHSIDKVVKAELKEFLLCCSVLPYRIFVAKWEKGEKERNVNADGK